MSGECCLSCFHCPAGLFERFFFVLGKENVNLDISASPARKSK